MGSGNQLLIPARFLRPRISVLSMNGASSCDHACHAPPPGGFPGLGTRATLLRAGKPALRQHVGDAPEQVFSWQLAHEVDGGLRAVAASNSVEFRWPGAVRLIAPAWRVP